MVFEYAVPNATLQLDHALATLHSDVAQSSSIDRRTAESPGPA
jgi:hypothetical protein